MHKKCHAREKEMIRTWLNNLCRDFCRLIMQRGGDTRQSFRVFFSRGKSKSFKVHPLNPFDALKKI